MCVSTLESELLHLRYKPRQANFAGCGECPAFDLFDWVIWTPNDRRFQRRRVDRPATVLCLAHPQSLDALVELRSQLNDVTLVVAGEDTLLSSVLDRIDLLVPHCRRVFYEAKDVDHPHVRSFGMGFNSFYLRRLDEGVVADLASWTNDPDWTKEGVLVAWGAIWRHLDAVVPDRKRAVRFVEASNWLVREELEPAEYFRRLAGSKFLLAPAGRGVQAPKLAEAWLMRTVPIVVGNPCFRDLRDLGFPFVILDEWQDLTPGLLEDFEETRTGIDWDRVCRMLTLRDFQESVLRESTDREVRPSVDVPKDRETDHSGPDAAHPVLENGNSESAVGQ